MAKSQIPVLKTDLPAHLHLIASGKVREIYELDELTVLFVTTDRISAYDVVMKNGIPLKGAILTSLSEFWFKLLQSLIPTLRTHFISLSFPPKLHETLPPLIISQLQHRCMQVRRLKVFPIEAIVRGYITGSAWREYTDKGTVHGIRVSGPNGTKLVESQAFEEPLYTPSTKAEASGKDENIHPDQAVAIVGEKYAERIEQLSLEIYSKARTYALSRGIIIADTKFEFGLDTSNDEIVLIDEVLTPDSSRFWPLVTYLPGSSQQSFDKQPLRDWLTENKLRGVEGVELPDDVVKETGGKYREAYERLVERAWGEEEGV